ncbi:MAG: cell division protein ZapA [Aerococcus sp.]|nr:cell division protein ZapA [Aerococcus sp.]
MTKQAMVKKRYQAKIRGKKFSIVSDKETAHMNRVTEQFNQWLEEASRQYPSGSNENIALLVGMNITSDMLELEAAHYDLYRHDRRTQKENEQLKKSLDTLTERIELLERENYALQEQIEAKATETIDENALLPAIEEKEVGRMLDNPTAKPKETTEQETSEGERGEQADTPTIAVGMERADTADDNKAPSDENTAQQAHTTVAKETDDEEMAQSDTTHEKNAVVSDQSSPQPAISEAEKTSEEAAPVSETTITKTAPEVKATPKSSVSSKTPVDIEETIYIDLTQGGVPKSLTKGATSLFNTYTPTEQLLANRQKQKQRLANHFKPSAGLSKTPRH